VDELVVLNGVSLFTCNHGICAKCVARSTNLRSCPECRATTRRL
jgi:hypothetical protein